MQKQAERIARPVFLWRGQEKPGVIGGRVHRLYRAMVCAASRKLKVSHPELVRRAIETFCGIRRLRATKRCAFGM
jgi:hypothetical protein